MDKEFKSVEEIMADKNLTNIQKQKAITINLLIDYCKAHDEVAWLKEEAAKTSHRKNRKTKEIEECKPSFLEIRNAFLKKFYPKVMGEAKPKKATFYELIENL